MSRDERRRGTATDVDNITLLSLCIGHTPDQTLRNRHPQFGGHVPEWIWA